MSIPKKERDLVFFRDRGLCVISGPDCTLMAECADHRANRGHGGSKILDHVSVLIAACVLCNSYKEDVHGEARDELIRRGVRVEKASTNALTLARCRQTPVTYPDGRMFFLLPDGTRQELTEVAF